MRTKLKYVVVLIVLYIFIGLISYKLTPNKLTNDYILRFIKYKIQSHEYPGLDGTNIYVMQNDIIQESFKVGKFNVVVLNQDELMQLTNNKDIFLGKITHKVNEYNINIVKITNWPHLASNSKSWYCAGGETWYSIKKDIWKSLFTPWNPWIEKTIHTVIG